MGNYRRAGFLWPPHFILFGSRPPGAPVRGERMRRICVKRSLFDIYPTSEEDLFGMLIWSDADLRSFNVQQWMKREPINRMPSGPSISFFILANPRSTDGERKRDQTALLRSFHPSCRLVSFSKPNVGACDEWKVHFCKVRQCERRKA